MDEEALGCFMDMFTPFFHIPVEFVNMLGSPTNSTAPGTSSRSWRSTADLRVIEVLL
jgi:hypothetical protein